jgi:hypothetical protein
VSTVPVPGSATAGAIAPSATANTWRDSAQYLLGSTPTGGGGKRPFFIGRQTVAQTLTTAVSTDITMDVEDVDTDSGHSIVTNTYLYTFNTAGSYLLIGTLAMAASATGDRAAWFHGTFNSVATDLAQTQFLASTAGASGTYATISALVTGVLVGDSVSLRGLQNTGGNLLTTTAKGGCRLQVLWIGN